MDRAERVARSASELRDQDVNTWQRQLIRGVLMSLVIIGPLALGGASYYAYVTGVIWLIPVYALLYAALCAVTFWQRIPYAVRVVTFMALIYLVTISDFLQDGRGGSGRLFLLVLISMSVLFFGRRGGVLTLGFALLTFGGFALAYSSGWLVLPPGQEIRSTDASGWVSNGVVFLMMSVLVLASQNYLVPRLTATLTQTRRFARDLEIQRADLERIVAERTETLARRARYLETTSEVARNISPVLEIHELLALVVNSIAEGFAFYHVGLFFTDPAGEAVVLKAASSVGGQRMLARGHRVRLGGQDLVGVVAMVGEARITLDVGENPVSFDRPDLPDTHSEMALPLRARNEIIGVLDVQSQEIAAFTQDDIRVFQTLADQVALSISNARLFYQVEESLEAQRRAYGELSAQAWQELLRERPDLGFAKQGETLTAVAEWDAEMLQAAQSGEPVLGSDASLAVPIKSGAQVIAVLDAHLPASGVWTPERIALLESLSDQVSQAIDRARLYQDTQRRAARERLLREVTARIRSSSDPETVLSTLLREVGSVLSRPTFVRLGSVEQLLQRTAGPAADGRVAAPSPTASERAPHAEGGQ